MNITAEIARLRSARAKAEAEARAEAQGGYLAKLSLLQEQCAHPGTHDGRCRICGLAGDQIAAYGSMDEKRCKEIYRAVSRAEEDRRKMVEKVGAQYVRQIVDLMQSCPHTNTVTITDPDGREPDGWKCTACGKTGDFSYARL